MNIERLTLQYEDVFNIRSYLPTFDDILAGLRIDTEWSGNVTDAYIQGMLDYLEIVHVFYSRDGKDGVDHAATTWMKAQAENVRKAEYPNPLNLASEIFTCHDVISIAAKRENNSYYLFTIDSNRANCAAVRIYTKHFKDDTQFLNYAKEREIEIIKGYSIDGTYIVEPLGVVNRVKLV